MPRPPSQFMIINDNEFVNASLSSIDSYNELRLDVAVAEASNSGELSLFCTGFNLGQITSSPSDYEFRIQNSGSLGSSSWIWSKSSAVDPTGASPSVGTWYGEPDLRFAHSIDNADIDDIAYGATAVYSKNTNKIFLYYKGSATNIIKYKSKDLSTEAGATMVWSSGTIDVSSIAGYGIDPYDQGVTLDTCELPDGTLLMLLSYNEDLYIYSSINGTTWSLYANEIGSRFANVKRDYLNCRIACSGNHVRIIGTYIEETQTGSTSFTTRFPFLSMVSNDSGVTWKNVTSDLVQVEEIEPAGGDRFSFDICSYDNNGTFIAVAMTNSGIGHMAYTTFVGSGNSELQESLEMAFHTLRPKSTFLVDYGDWIVSLTIGVTSRSDLTPDPEVYSTKTIAGWGSVDILESRLVCYEYLIQYMNKTESPLTSEWKNLNSSYAISGFYGAMRMVAARGSLFNTGKGLSFFAAIRDVEIPLNYGYTRGAIYREFSGWSTRPVRDYNLDNFLNITQANQYSTSGFLNKHQPSGRLLAPQWDAGCGIPDQGTAGGIYTPWKFERTTGSRSSVYWNRGRDMYLYDWSTAVAGHQNYFKYIDPSFFELDRWSFAYVPSLADSVFSTVAGVTNFFGFSRYISHSGDTPKAASFTPNCKTPTNNWVFLPEYNSRDEGTKWSSNTKPHGSCVVWVAKFDDGTTTFNGNQDFMVVGLSAYSMIGQPNGGADGDLLSPYRVDCVVRHGQDRVVLFDRVAGASMAEIVPDSGTYGVTPFKSYWEYRWGWYPFNGGEPVNSLTSNWKGKCILMCRKLGTDTWLSTGVQTPNYSAAAIQAASVGSKIMNQMLYFGHYESNPTQKSFWKSLGIHAGNDLGTFGYNDAAISPVQSMQPIDMIRGREVGDRPVTFDSSIASSTAFAKAVWGGASGVYNDRFKCSVKYAYPPTNINQFGSPRIKYRTEKSNDKTSTSSANIVLKTKNPEEIFYHNSVAFINTNSSSVEVSYSMDNSSFSSPQVIDFARIKNGRIMAATSNILTINWDTNNLFPSEITSNDKKKFYLQIDVASTGTTYDKYLISKSFGTDTFVMDIDNSNVSTVPVGIVASTVSIYADRAYAIYSSPSYGRYMKISIPEYNRTATQYGEIGSVVAGCSLNFDVPLSWSFTDDEKANQEVFRSRSGIQWSYNKGPSVRELSLNMIGDVTQQNRRTIREQIKGINGYGENNMVFITDTNSSDSEMIFHGKYQNSTQFKNDGWYYDEDNKLWRPIGNMGIKLTEII